MPSVAVREECGFETCPAADRWEGTREAESSGLVLSMSLDYNSVNFLMIIVILLVILLLVALTGFCVWKRKRKQSRKCGSPGGAVARPDARGRSMGAQHLRFLRSVGT